MKRLLPFAFPVILLLTWEAAARSGLWSPLLFPPLEKIGRELVLLFSKPETLMEALVTLYRALGGFALAAVVGILVGMLMGRSKLVAGLLDPLFSGTYAVPKLALFPIFIFVFGIGSLSKVALVFLECLYPIVIMSYHGAAA
jgi:ABC-type nitrate/sulfonate/bicarbonate transport system permease component